MCHAELELQSEGPSLIKTGITPLFYFSICLIDFILSWWVLYQSGKYLMCLFFLNSDCSKDWISCSKRYRKQSFLLFGFGKAPIPKGTALMDFHSACCRRRGGWDCVPWRGVSQATQGQVWPLHSTLVWGFCSSFKNGNGRR